MFYTPYVVYKDLPNGEQLESLVGRGYSVYIYRRRTSTAAPGLRRVRAIADLTGQAGAAGALKQSLPESNAAGLDLEREFACIARTIG